MGAGLRLNANRGEMGAKKYGNWILRDGGCRRFYEGSLGIISWKATCLRRDGALRLLYYEGFFTVLLMKCERIGVIRLLYWSRHLVKGRGHYLNEIVQKKGKKTEEVVLQTKRHSPGLW